VVGRPRGLHGARRIVFAIGRKLGHALLQRLVIWMTD
jgi:hypothetical protein